ncbi:MAG: glutathione S-transferase family protein [Rhizobiaceae bacterium]|nr:glutathione S-transferase family protein [Rhizobiaceae bacterium]
MTSKPRLFGADYSVYVRIARLALAEKTIDYELVSVDIFDPAGVPDWYRDRHPFKRIPAFEHGDLRLFETSAICRYVDEGFDGPPLQPGDAAGRAAMNQIIGMLDAYAYRAMVWGVYVERAGKASRGEVSDEDVIAASMAVAETCLASLTRLMGSAPWLAGSRLTLADLHAAPMFAYFTQADEGAALLDAHPAVAAWWERIQARSSFQKTRPATI